ncbi:MAG: SH3 domain-containing protein [Pseudomonadota bacterium]|nr:SH3 domain-containing protein [Pseudomonadota bacterium]
MVYVGYLQLSTHYSKTEQALPRFVSLKQKEVNLRTGPNKKYPIHWVYLNQKMPVEIIAEFRFWRQIRDWENTVGWVHKRLLTNKRRIIVLTGTHPIKKSPSYNSPVIALVEEKVIGELEKCKKDWCRINFGEFRGWMQQSQFWGRYPREKI